MWEYLKDRVKTTYSADVECSDKIDMAVKIIEKEILEHWYNLMEFIEDMSEENWGNDIHDG